MFEYLKAEEPTKRPGQRPPERRVVEVGYILDAEKAGFIWEAPRQCQRRGDPPVAHAKSVAVCPAVLDYEARLFEVVAPIDMQLRFRFDDNGQPQLINALGERSPIRSKHLRQMVAVMPRSEWRHPDRPIIQLITPYIFVSDDICWMNQMPPFNSYTGRMWPGLMIGGRLPIHIWPRPMMWAFEWYDTTKDLVLRRGEPWFYMRFESDDPRRPIRLVEAVKDERLETYMRGLNSVTNYVGRTFSLFQVAEQRRPPKLLTRKEG
ncbi:MAG: hypothetical protein VYB54_12095 [Pseudomonadota bacterium]|nr:hypothetical protein [Pseudomonadota bacterium]